MGSGGGGGQQTSTAHTSNAPWGPAQAADKAYISALLGLVFPGMTMPANYLPKGWNFGSSASGGGSSGSGTTQVPTPAIDPSVAFNFLNPMIGSSASLQKLYQQNPGAITSGASPAAMNQLAQIYGNLGKPPIGAG